MQELHITVDKKEYIIQLPNSLARDLSNDLDTQGKDIRFTSKELLERFIKQFAKTQKSELQLSKLLNELEAVKLS